MTRLKSEQFHHMQATVETVGFDDGMIVKRLLSYDSVVCDLDLDTRTVYLYPRYQYSVTTVRQVTRFLNEYMPLANDERWTIALIRKAHEHGFRAVCKCPGIFRDYRVMFRDCVLGTNSRW